MVADCAHKDEEAAKKTKIARVLNRRDQSRSLAINKARHSQAEEGNGSGKVAMCFDWETAAVENPLIDNLRSRMHAYGISNLQYAAIRFCRTHGVESTS